MTAQARPIRLIGALAACTLTLGTLATTAGAGLGGPDVRASADDDRSALARHCNAVEEQWREAGANINLATTPAARARHQKEVRTLAAEWAETCEPVFGSLYTVVPPAATTVPLPPTLPPTPSTAAPSTTRPADASRGATTTTR